MSRSYKKTPRAGDTKDKFYKRYANKLIRKNKYELYQHKNFKRVFCSWNICDYQSIMSFEEFYEDMIEQWFRWRYNYEPFPDKKEAYQRWRRWYKMK